MGFRHYRGSPPVARVAWVCPTCGASNTNALEEGCPACKAGADAGKARTHAPEPVPPDTPIAVAFNRWRNSVYLSRDVDADLESAFNAGAAWAQQQPAAPAGNAPSGSDGDTASPVAAPSGGWVLGLLHPETKEIDTLMDIRTQQTIVAALAFYRDNQLAYGVIPGQLSAQECTQLITQLSPQETEEPK